MSKVLGRLRLVLVITFRFVNFFSIDFISVLAPLKNILDLIKNLFAINFVMCTCLKLKNEFLLRYLHLNVGTCTWYVDNIFWSYFILFPDRICHSIERSLLFSPFDRPMIDATWCRVHVAPEASSIEGWKWFLPELNMHTANKHWRRCVQYFPFQFIYNLVQRIETVAKINEVYIFRENDGTR